MTLNRLIGSGPDQVSVNGMLGDLAFQSADNVSLGDVLVDGDITLDDGAGTFVTTLQTITATVNRTISLPDATGTVALVAGSSGQLVVNQSGAQAGVPGSVVGATGDLTLALNGAASTPPLNITGTWFTGGTATTTKPQVLVEPAGTTSTAWSTSGTGLGVNAASGFAGNLLDLQLNGTSRFSVDTTGYVKIAATQGSTGVGSWPILYRRSDGVIDSDANITISNNADNLSVNGLLLSATAVRGSGTSLSLIVQSASQHVRLSNTDLQLGAPSGGPIIFGTASSQTSLSSEWARIDSSGRLLVGTSTAPTGTLSANSLAHIRGNTASSSGGGQLNLSSNQTSAGLNGWGGAYQLGRIIFTDTQAGEYAHITCTVDTNNANVGSYPGRLVFSTTADGASTPTERLRITSTGSIGLSGANYGTSGQALISNGSTAAPTWQSIAPTTVFGWNHTNDNYGLYLPGTSIRAGDLSGTVDIDVQSRLRRCVINNTGVVQYYLDADDSTLKAGDWLRIVETESLTVTYTGTTTEATNSLLRTGVPAWAAGTFTNGQRVTHNGFLWECIAASTTATPAAGTVASVLDGTDGQVVVEVPAFSVRYGFAAGVHTREVRLGCRDSLIAQGFQPHPTFIRTDGTYKSAFYLGAYHAYSDGTNLASVSGQTNTRSLTRSTFRTRAALRGTGWHIHSYLEHAAIQTLLVTEYRDHNSQKVVGRGSQEGSVYGVSTGLSNFRGNRSGNAYTAGGANTDYVSYRGIENLWGRAWQWVDGFNVYERVVYLTNNQTVFADNTSVGYRFYAQVPSGSASYQKEIFPLPDVFLPSVVTGASDTTYLGDAFWTSAGWRVARVGGDTVDGAPVGAFMLSLLNPSSAPVSFAGARSCYALN